MASPAGPSIPLERHLHAVALLLLRGVLGGLMAFGHGLPKLLAWTDKADGFPDPLGVGSPTSLALTIAAELGCALFLVFGLGTRIVLVPLILTMVVAAFVVHADDPFAKKELALLYLVPFVALVLAGPGELSLDAALRKRRQRSPED